MRVRAPNVPWWLCQILCRTNRRTLLKTLRQLTPPIEVVHLGRGCHRSAYHIRISATRWVVVKFAEPSTLITNRSRSSRVKHAPTRRIGMWDVQYYYSPCHREHDVWMYRLRGDIKSSNCGYDLDGTLVQFDW